MDVDLRAIAIDLVMLVYSRTHDVSFQAEILFLLCSHVFPDFYRKIKKIRFTSPEVPNDIRMV